MIPPLAAYFFGGSLFSRWCWVSAGIGGVCGTASVLLRAARTRAARPAPYTVGTAPTSERDRRRAAAHQPRLRFVRRMRRKIVPKTMVVPTYAMGPISWPNETAESTIEKIWRVVMMIVNTTGPNLRIV